MTETADALRSRFRYLVEGLGDAACEQVAATFLTHELEAGASLVEQGHHFDAMCLVTAGGLRIYKGIGDKEYLVGTVGRGNSIGELFVVRPAEIAISLRASDRTKLLMLRHADLEGLGEAEPHLASTLLRGVSRAQVRWLRAFEAYMSDRKKPNDIDECIACFRKLLGLEEA